MPEGLHSVGTSTAAGGQRSLTETPGVASDDLSGGTLPLEEEQRVNLGLEEQRHRFQLQLTVANAALTFAALFFMAAIVFGALVIYAIAVAQNRDLHWHASIIVAAFVVPPTLLVVALVRAVYETKQKEADTGPALTFLKEVVSAITAVFKKSGG